MGRSNDVWFAEKLATNICVLKCFKFRDKDYEVTLVVKGSCVTIISFMSFTQILHLWRKTYHASWLWVAEICHSWHCAGAQSSLWLLQYYLIHYERDIQYIRCITPFPKNRNLLICLWNKTTTKPYSIKWGRLFGLIDAFWTLSKTQISVKQFRASFFLMVFPNVFLHVPSSKLNKWVFIFGNGVIDWVYWIISHSLLLNLISASVPLLAWQ